MVLADNELIAVYSLAVSPTSPVVHRDQQHCVCCENSLYDTRLFIYLFIYLFIMKFVLKVQYKNTM